MLRGKIESVKNGALVGWLWDDAAPEAHVDFSLIVNDRAVGRFVADAPRADLRRAGIGRGDHAFRIPLDRAWSTDGTLRFAIGLDDRPAIGIDALSVDMPRGAPVRPDASADITANTGLRGRIERVAGHYLEGWVWDAASPGPVTFTLVVNDKAVGDHVANRRRGDLAEAGIGDGAHGFRIRINPAWLVAGENHVTLRTLPEHHWLADRLTILHSENHDRRVGDHPAARVKGQSPASSDGADPLLPREMVAQMRGWSTKRLVAFHQTLEKDILLERAKELFRKKQWTELGKFYPTALPDRRGRTELDLLVGRSLLYERKAVEAARILAPVADVQTTDAAAQFYASVAAGRAGDNERAVEYGRAAIALSPDHPQYLIDHATHARRHARAQIADASRRNSLLVESTEALHRALALSDARADYCLYTIARNHADGDRLPQAVETIERLLETHPDHVDALLLLSQILVPLNRIKEALSAAERVLQLDPLRQAPRFLLRSLKSLVEHEARAPVTIGVAVWHGAESVVHISRLDADGTAEPGTGIALEFAADPAMALASIDLDWLVIAEGEWPAGIASDLVAKLRTAAPSRGGRAVVHLDTGASVILWRRDLLVGLAESGEIPDLGLAPRILDDLSDIVETIVLPAPRPAAVDLIAEAADLPRGPVVVMSRHGIVKFGGGEQFLDSMAEHYEELGFDPIVVGTRDERIDEEGRSNGRRYAFIEPSPAALRAYFLRVRPAFVHVLSGLGYEVAEALEYLSIPFVYGVHFWRDCLGAVADDQRFFLAHDREPVPRPAFRFVIETAATVYANSEFTRATLEDAFGMRPPVIYSLPREVVDQHPGATEEVDAVIGDWRDYILLVNAKSDKGFDLIVDVAKRVPDAHFLAIASQSDRAEAEAAVRAAGIGNLRIVSHTDRMDIVYSRARAVAVPSYAFVETFSRVCIEAQRYRKPVLGSTVGNVPFLLRDSGVILPDEPVAWANEIRRLYRDEAHYAALCEAAENNAATYSYATQDRAVRGMISTMGQSLLIGVGSGIGNMLHVGPMIRNISRRLGRKVDLVVTEDHTNSLFLLQNDDYVNTVYSVRPEVLHRRYDTVFITHSFGNARLPFESRRVLYARDWQGFEPGGALHETTYNLESAKAVLGIPYDQDDIAGHYLGNLRRRHRAGPGPLRIGFHGGSKDGFWASKRWPGHAELAARLRRRGFAVASFGIAEEFVPDTENRTGGTIAEMAGAMLDLDYFVSNDSGVMNVANALGIPVMSLFAPTNPLTRGPLGPRNRWLAVDKPCSPCEVTRIGLKTFQSGHCACIAELTVNDVERGVLDHLHELGLA
jgi:glycosyltransferase involved in cell wall biosynthesis/tetratricopeptide (TPR) repeat protein